MKHQFSLKAVLAWLTGFALVFATVGAVIRSIGWDDARSLGGIAWFGCCLMFLAFGVPAIAATLALGSGQLAWHGITSKQSIAERIGTLTSSLVMAALGSGGLYWWAFHFMGPIIASGK